jgi:fructose-bisphosphate aldolase class II
VPLVPTGALVAAAAARHRAIGAFNVITLEHAEAIVAGAEAAGAAVILQVSQNAVGFHGGRLRPTAAACTALAAEASMDVALHLDHVEDPTLLRQAADAGFSSVMFDAGRLPHDENIARTAEAAEWAHAHGLWIEAELGYVGGKPDAPASAHAPGVRTDPAEAAAYVQSTGVDALAVAVGSSHAMTERTARLDHDLVAALRDAVLVPLVLHGSSGVPEAELRAAVEHGIVKVNVGTALNVAYTGAVRETLADGAITDPRKYLAPARDAASEVVRSIAELLGGGLGGGAAR